MALTTYFENIQYRNIYFHYGLSLAKTSHNDSFLFLEVIAISNFDFFENVYFSQIFKLPHNYSPNYLF